MKSLGLYLYDEIISNDYFKTIFEKLSKSYTSQLVDGLYNYNLTEKEEKDLFRFVDLLASMEEQSARMKAYHIISLLDVFIGETAKFKYIASSVYSKLGLFALDFDDSKLPFDRRFEVATKKFSQKFDERYVFTDSQYEIYSKMVKAPHYSFSGPTSLGKSFIIKRYIEEVVQASRSNIVILVPSKALINQFSLEIKSELKSILHEKNYSVLTHGNLVTEDDDEKYIFILTPERLLSLYSQKVDITIDFLFVDEAHKLSNSTDSDTRSLTAYSAIENTINNYQNVKVVFSSPNISNPEVFLELFGKDSNHTTKVSESPVAQNLYLVDFKFNELTLFISNEKYKVETNIFNASRQANDFIYRIGSKQKSNMVYCSSRDKSISSALSFCKDFIKHKVVLSEKLKDAIEKVSAYIHKEYYLAYFLEKRVAYHHGQLPPVIRNIVEELFRDGEIDFIFCTPTLVEGVNMPTRNIFINCDSKIRLVQEKNKNANKSIAFWNLAGRAGRYCKELSGNIFCIQNSEGERWEDTSIFENKNTEISTTIDTKLSSQKSLKEIEKALSDENYNSKEVSKLVEYLANLISIDTIRFNKNLNDSFLLRKFVALKKDEILELAKKKSQKIEDIPIDVINTYKALNFDVQSTVYSYISDNPERRKLPKLDYENILATLKVFNNIYNWEATEKDDIKSEAQLSYYATLMNNWINGKPINGIINDSLANTATIQLERGGAIVDFERDNPDHVNRVIDKTLYTIERVLTFIFEKYFNHYHKCLCSVLGEEQAGSNWSTFLEYGSKIPMEIGLQNLGLSRHTAHNIASKSELQRFVQISSTGEVLSIEKSKLLQRLNQTSIEYNEIATFV